ncbi:MAG: ABC transporter ATP-binding protein [Promethearchaeota archaeon]
MNSIRMIFKYWTMSKKNFLIALFFQILTTFFALIIPRFIGLLVGSLDPNSKNPATTLSLWTYFFLIIIFALLTFVTSRIGRLKGAKVATTATYILRSDINNAIHRQSFSYFDKTETGQLVARATSDVEETEMIFGMGLVLGVQGLIQLTGVIIASFLLSKELAMVYVIAIPISLIASVILAKKMKPIYLERRESFGEITNTMQENIVGAEVIRIFSTQEKERKKFVEHNTRFYNASVSSVKYNSLFMPINVLIIGGMVVLTLYIGGNLVLQGDLDLGTLIAFQSYVGLTMFPLFMLGNIMLMYIQADAALTRIREVLEATPDVKDVPGAIPIKQLKGDVDFEDVSFGYTHEHRVLKDVSFRVPAGEKLAILGTTGSGKSTIINLLPRFYEINSGIIKIDGIDNKKYLLKDLRKNIGIVSQESFIFNKSIKDNISFGKDDATEDEIIEATKIADLHDFIMTLSKGYDTIVGERGTRLSGGQKQRLSIARALITKPKILIFDDSTSSVDVETEYKIQQALEKIMSGTTTFIITQRISTIRDADQILMLDKGRVVGLGTHDKLINSNVLYKQIYQTLFQKQKGSSNEMINKTQGGN